MDPEIIGEIKGRKVLHWNFRGLRELPIELKYHGDQVEEMYLKWNNFMTLPLWIKDMKLLTNLYLYGNGLQYLPEEIGELTLLNTLYLENNQLKTLPKTIGRLKNLNYLNLELNCIEILPPEIGQLRALYILNLKGNGLRNLPAVVGTMNSLQELILDCNRLTHLPRNIVYLPNINYLSLNGNNLMYLPSVWFISNPKISFTHNPYLNYLSYDWGSALTREENLLLNGTIWYFNISGCFTKSIESPEELKSHLMISIKENILVLPSAMKNVSGSKYYNIPSLFELTARNVYGSLFSTKDIRKCWNPNILKQLPCDIQELLWHGPVALCHYCRRPIFTECVLWIMWKYVLNEQEDLPNRIMACLHFCDRNCCAFFSENELKNGNQIDNITSYRIEWILQNCIF